MKFIKSHMLIAIIVAALIVVGGVTSGIIAILSNNKSDKNTRLF